MILKPRRRDVERLMTILLPLFGVKKNTEDFEVEDYNLKEILTSMEFRYDDMKIDIKGEKKEILNKLFTQKYIADIVMQIEEMFSNYMLDIIKGEWKRDRIHKNFIEDLKKSYNKSIDLSDVDNFVSRLTEKDPLINERFLKIVSYISSNCDIDTILYNVFGMCIKEEIEYAKSIVESVKETETFKSIDNRLNKKEIDSKIAETAIKIYAAFALTRNIHARKEKIVIEKAQKIFRENYIKGVVDKLYKIFLENKKVYVNNDYIRKIAKEFVGIDEEYILHKNIINYSEDTIDHVSSNLYDFITFFSIKAPNGMIGFNKDILMFFENEIKDVMNRYIQNMENKERFIYFYRFLLERGKCINTSDICYAMYNLDVDGRLHYISALQSLPETVFEKDVFSLISTSLVFALKNPKLEREEFVRDVRSLGRRINDPYKLACEIRKYGFCNYKELKTS